MPASKSRILYTKPSITEAEVAAVTLAAREGWGARCYDAIVNFEEGFRQFVGTQHAIATSSCTGALHLGLSALGIGPGDEVILGEANWVASAAPITYLGAKPVFVDVLPDSWCLDPEQVARAITPATKAIIAVHLYGNLCQMPELLALGEKHGIPIIEDAAEALGTYYGQHHAGSMGRFGVFSFHGTKTLTTGEGGMFVTNNRQLYEHVLTLSNHGRVAGGARQFWADYLGFKYKMSNLQAALGCAQMQRIDSLIARKREIFQYYQQGLSDLPGVTMNPEPSGTRNGYWMPTVVFPEDSGVTREKLLSTFAEENIDGRVFFWPLSSLPMFSAQPEHRIAYALPGRAINLPSYHDLSADEQDRVIAAVKRVAQYEA